MSSSPFLQRAVIALSALSLLHCARGQELTDARANADGTSIDGSVDGAPGMDGNVGMDARGCTNNGECVSPTPFCETTLRMCVQCLPLMDRCPVGQACDPATRTCRAGCRNDMDCASLATSDGGVSEGGISDASSEDGGLAIPSLRCLVGQRRCVQCTTDDHCPSGTLCMGNTCVRGCNAMRPCPSMQACCSGMCRDLDNDPMSCGTCGMACPSTASSCCAGRCVSTRNDSGNCGACGQACNLPNATAICTSGMCDIGTCAEGWRDGDSNSANGCECQVGRAGTSCEMARDLGSVGAGGSQNLSGVVVNPSDEHWYRVRFVAPGSPRLRFMTNPSNMLRFEVRAGCDPSTLRSCPNRMGGALGITEWQFTDTPGTHRTRNVPYPSEIYFRVVTTAPLEGCAQYTLIVSN